MSSKSPTEQEKLFSQADPRVVQRPFGIDQPGPEPVVPAQGSKLEQYSPPRVTPGKFDENWIATNNSVIVGGSILLLDKDLGFNCHTVLVDNWTNQWLRVDGVRRSVPPYSGGWVFNAVSGMQQGRVELKAPSTAIAQLAPVAGEYVWIGFAEAVLSPNGGTSVSTTTAPVDVNLISLLFGEDPNNNVFRIAPKDTFQVTSFPAAATVASASRVAAGAGVRNVCTEVTFSIDAVAAQTIIFVTLRDGATGAGTILRQWIVPPQAAAGAFSQTWSGLWIAGTANTAMTVETTNQAGAVLAPAATNFAACEWTGTTEI